jgi:hypothetical protein
MQDTTRWSIRSGRCVALLAVLAATTASAEPPAVSPATGQYFGQLVGVEVPTASLVEAAPVLAVRGDRRAAERSTPLILHVPAGEIENWPRYCGKYQACTVPVNFVSERWFRQVFLTQDNSQDGSEQTYLIEQERDSQDARAQNHRHSKPQQ